MVGLAGAVIDTRALGKCPNFSGEQSQWSEWKFHFTSWVTLLDWNGLDIEEYLGTAAASPPETLDMSAFGPSALSVAKSLYAMFALLCKG